MLLKSEHSERSTVDMERIFMWSRQSSKQGTDVRVEDNSGMASSFWVEGVKGEGPPTAMGPNADAIGVVRCFYLSIEKLFWNLNSRVSAVSCGHDYGHCLS